MKNKLKILETSKGNYKFMQTLDPKIYRSLKRIGKKKGLIVQEVIRAVVIPEWFLFDQRRETWLNSEEPVRRTGKGNGKRMEPGHDLQKKDPDVPPSTGT